MGHTKGNSIIIVEMDGLFYMIHGDITYVDEALPSKTFLMIGNALVASKARPNSIRHNIVL